MITAFLAACLVVIAALYFSFDTDYNFLLSKQEMLDNPIWLTSFYIHLAFGIISVIAGFILFFNRLVRFTSKLHKQIGKLYIISILFLTGPTGFYLSFYAEGGALASIGFIMMSFFWMYLTYMAFAKIIKGDIQSHYKWMIRSYCFTLSGITLRLFTPIGVQIFGLDYETNFIFSAYIPWMLNLAIGELLIYLNRKSIKNYKLLITKS